MITFLSHAPARIVSNGSAFARLTRAERRVALSAAFHLILYRLLLRWSGTRRFLAQRRPRDAKPPAHKPRVGAIEHEPSAAAIDRSPDVERLCAQVADVAKRLHLSSTCLTRALVVRHLLEREGVLADVRIGVALDRSGLSAHAWIEHCGRPVFDRKHASYAPFEAQRIAASPVPEQ